MKTTESAEEDWRFEKVDGRGGELGSLYDLICGTTRITCFLTSSTTTIVTSPVGHATRGVNQSRSGLWGVPINIWGFFWCEHAICISIEVIRACKRHGKTFICWPGVLWQQVSFRLVPKIAGNAGDRWCEGGHTSGGHSREQGSEDADGTLLNEHLVSHRARSKAYRRRTLKVARQCVICARKWRRTGVV